MTDKCNFVVNTVKAQFCKNTTQYTCIKCKKNICYLHSKHCGDCDSYHCNYYSCEQGHDCAEIQRHRELMNKLNEITELLQALVYAPQGPKYQEAKADFESQKSE